eukprot:Platyproteum_vivax@DN1689_c0_g1_i1.p1
MMEQTSASMHNVQTTSHTKISFRESLPTACVGSARWLDRLHTAREVAQQFDNDCLQLCQVQRNMEERVPWRGQYAREMNPRVRESLSFMDTISQLIKELPLAAVESRLSRASMCFNQAAEAASKFREVVNTWADKEDTIFMFHSRTCATSTGR